MNCLLVVSHPVENSLCQFLTNETKKHLESKGYNVTLKDLYKENFNPLLSQSERNSYYHKFDDKLLKLDIDQLKNAESLVLIFPTWWFGFPAILKGWIDRVWAPGHAYNHASDLSAITPLLSNLKEVKVITTLGSALWVNNLVLFRPVNRILRIAILGACVKKCTFRMLNLYKSENLNKQRVEKFIGKIKKSF